MIDKTAINNKIFTPNEAAMMTFDRSVRVRDSKDRGVKLPIDSLDKYFAPLLPGQVAAVIAQSSNYKSGFINWWEQELAKQIEAEGRDEIIVHISTEDLVEEQMWFEMGKELGVDAGEIARGEVPDWKLMEMVTMKLSSGPIYRIGNSLKDTTAGGDLYLTNIIRALTLLQNGTITGRPMKFACVFLDYLQAIPYDPEIKNSVGSRDNMRRLQVKEDIYRIRKGAAYFDCPWIVGVQAKQHLSGAPDEDFQLPGLYDGEESSAIGQHADRIITLWMPKMSHPHMIGGHLEYKGIRFPVEPNVLLLKVAKQRGRLSSGGIWLLRIDFIKNTFSRDPNFGISTTPTTAFDLVPRSDCKSSVKPPEDMEF